jgi:hypothetical protein
MRRVIGASCSVHRSSKACGSSAVAERAAKYAATPVGEDIQGLLRGARSEWNISYLILRKTPQGTFTNDSWSFGTTKPECPCDSFLGPLADMFGDTFGFTGDALAAATTAQPVVQLPVATAALVVPVNTVTTLVTTATTLATAAQLVQV